jgi:hypothetical protein
MLGLVIIGNTKGKVFGMQVSLVYGLVMCPGVMLALVIGKIFLPRVTVNIICILGNFITHPELSHFHRLQALSYDSFFHNTNGSW